MPAFDGQYIILGVTGSIAIYRAIDVARRLAQAGALVDVIMTDGAMAFVTPLTFASVTGRHVVSRQFDAESELSIAHVRMAERAALLLVAPATANTIAKLALGLSDDPLTTTALACRAPLLVAPAMETNMLEHAATQQHLDTLRARGAGIVPSESGALASGRSGDGRLAGVDTILAWAATTLGRVGDMAGRHVLVTAGGTQEPIDPVRRITNRSSGKMGYALAIAARDRGASVTLVSAPTALPAPPLVEVVAVTTTRQMYDAVMARSDDCDVIIKAAAVADFRVADAAEHKIKRAGRDSLELHLVATTDIAAAIGARRTTSGRPAVLVVFAAESDDLEANARGKLEAKNADLLVANDISASDAGFESDDNRVVVFDRQGGSDHWPLLPKPRVADRILDRIVPLLT